MNNASKSGTGKNPQGTKGTVEETLMRLCREKAVLSKKYFALGVDDGILWVQRAHYEDMADWAMSAIGHPRGVCGLPDEVMDGALDMREETPGFDYVAYERGWHQAVLPIWHELERRVSRVCSFGV